MRMLNTALAGLALLAAACSPSTVSEESGAQVAADTTAQTTTDDAPSTLVLEGPAAPDFTLTDSTGDTHALAAYLADGKIVVLEWFNPDCPFVKAFHETGAMAATADQLGDDVVWLAVNSGAPGKQGSGKDRQNQAIAGWNLPYPVLLDEDGTVGRAYKATNTPHMFVIKDGLIVYQGAIASAQKPGEGENYVISAVTALRDGRMPETTSTKAFGCSVKYVD